MSKELDGVIPDLEEVQDQIASYVVLGMHCVDREGQSSVYSGTLVGVSIEDISIKLDISSSIEVAYDFISSSSRQGFSCSSCFLFFGDRETQIDGPYKIKCTRMLEIDREQKMCVLGVDLIKT